jgi:carbonic anhydrase/acetyltransferase-like protein (isoleucine patch superfamily)
MSEVRMGGPVKMDPTCFVAPGAVVVGDVRLEARSSIWFNTVVRGDSAEVRVGEDSNLQDNSVVHEDEGLPTLIGARVTVGHRTIIHGCVIEDECLIGMGSIVLSGARIGAGSLVGAGALVREGQVVPPGSLAVGAPARVVGPVSDSHRASIRNGWRHYAELASVYSRSGCARHLDRTGAILHDRAPMNEVEWSQSLRMLREFPDHLANAMTASNSSPESAIDVFESLVTRDRTLRLPVLMQLAAGDRATIPSEERPSGPPGRGPEPGAEWPRVREELCAALASLGPAGGQAQHSTRGPFTLPELVREWIDEDLEQARRLANPGGRRP